jgi:hypothetical protein
MGAVSQKSTRDEEPLRLAYQGMTQIFRQQEGWGLGHGHGIQAPAAQPIALGKSYTKTADGC